MAEETATNPGSADGENTPEPQTEEVARTAETEETAAEIETTDPEGQPEDDTEEVEHAGQKYRVPKAVKPLLMMNADYTRKTQEVAGERKTLEAERQSFQQQVKSQTEFLKDNARLVSLDDQLEQWAQVNWQQLSQEDPVNAQKLWFHYNQIKDARDKLAGQVKEKHEKRVSDEQREYAKRAEESRAFLVREIPEWSPELETKLAKFALDQGFTQAELNGLAVNNPRAVKVLHLAHIGQTLLAKQREAAKPKTPPAEPVPVVTSSRTTSAKDPSRMSTDEWMRWRNKQAASGR